MFVIANEIQPIPSDWQERPIITQHNANNELVVRTYGKTQDELLEDHLNGKCDMWCNHCYYDAMNSLEQEEPMDYPELYEPDGYTCPVCGGHMEGDNYNIPVHCENVEVPDGAEADSGPYYCKAPAPDIDNLWDTLDVPF